MAVIERVCRENGADLTEADLHEAKAVKEDFAGQTLEYRGENYELALAGSYQTENAALALEALEVLGRVGYPTTVEQRKKRSEGYEMEWTSDNHSQRAFVYCGRST